MTLHELSLKALSRRHWLLGAASAYATGAWAQSSDPTGGDPLGSMQWPSLQRSYIGRAPWRFAPSLQVQGPPFAEDALNVPLRIDARALVQEVGPVERMVVLADRNPVQQVLTFEPLQSSPQLALRFRLEQSSPVRALARTPDGRWHVGQTWVQAAGGGCTVPGQSRADGSWSRHLGQVQARLFRNLTDSGMRLRLRVMHPMDTGLVAGVPAFHIEKLELLDGAGQACWRLALHEPVSENPLLTFELGPRSQGPWQLLGHDNNGNRISARVSA
jgi:sulfur-oxidizing protein SoxY